MIPAETADMRKRGKIIPKFSQPYSAPGKTTEGTYSLSRSQ